MYFFCKYISKTEQILKSIESINGREYTLQVANNDVSITNEKLKGIFKYGNTAKKQSSGFGLFSVVNFIKDQGAAISVKSDGKNRGVIFTIRFPISVSIEVLKPGN